MDKQYLKELLLEFAEISYGDFKYFLERKGVEIDDSELEELINEYREELYS